MSVPRKSIAPRQPDVFLMFSLVLAILLHPFLDHGDFRRVLLGFVMFVPILLATVRLSATKRWMRISVSLMLATVGFSLADMAAPHQVFTVIRFGLLAAFFAVTVARLFYFLNRASSVEEAHLATAVSVYLLLGMIWYSLYSAIEAVSPGAISFGANRSNRQSELLYFSLVTLSTAGYGDIVPIHAEVRMLAVLESITGVFYIATTVAFLVSAYQKQNE